MGNRYTALIDACSLVSALGRNTLLSLAEAGLFRVRWSDKIPGETERALAGMFADRGDVDPAARAARSVNAMRRAFPESMVAVQDVDPVKELDAVRDPGGAHVVASAVACRAAVIVTENVRDFRVDRLEALSIEIGTADEFLANTIDLDRSRAAEAITRMRRRFGRPSLSVDELLLKYESQGFLATSDLLREARSQLD